MSAVETHNYVISQYRKELERHPILSREEEESLYPVLHSCKQSRDRIINANLRIAMKSAIAFHKRSPREDLSELISEANLGLAKAMDKFDTSKGVRFSTYAQTWIDNRLFQREIYSSSCMPLPKDVYFKFKYMCRLLSEGKREEEVFNALGLHQNTFDLLMSYKDRSFVEWDERDSSLNDTELSSEAELQRAEDLEAIEAVKRAAEQLSERHKTALGALYGCFGEEKTTQIELAKKLDSTISKIRKLQQTALMEVKDQLISE
jgi:RNA polymerase sigma factor (sigma-70 family)